MVKIMGTYKKSVIEQRTYTITEVKNILGLSRPTVYSRIEDGTLKAFKAGRQWRVTEQALKEFMKPDNQ